MKESSKVELSRSLTLFSLIMMGVGMMIGAGVFVGTGASIAKGGSGAVLIAFVVNGLIALFTAMSYAELSSAIPRAGGPYNWANYGLGSVPGFLAGWMEWLAACVAGSLYAKTFAKYIVKFLNEEIFISFLNWNLYSNVLFILEIFITVFITLTFIYVNYRGVSETGKAAVIFALGQQLCLILIIGTAIYLSFKAPLRFANFTPFLPHGWDKVLYAMGITYVAFEGFEVICQAGDETIDPKRNIPKALFFSVIIVVITYLLISFSVTIGATLNKGINIAEWFTKKGPATAFADAVKGIISYGGWLVPMAVLFSATSALNSTIFSGTRISYALGRDNFLPGSFSKISNKTRVPSIALFFTSGLVLFIAVFVPIEHVLAAASILFLFVFMVGNIAVIKIRKDHSHKLKYGYIMPFFPFLTIIAIIFQLGMIAKLFQESIWTWPIVFGWIFIGGIVYIIYSSKNHKKIEMPVIEIEKQRYAKAKDYNILIPVSNPATVEEFTKVGSAIAAYYDGEITFFNFIYIPEQSPLSIVDDYLKESKKLINSSKKFLKKNIPNHSSIKYGRDKYKGIMQTVSDEKTNLLIMGWMGERKNNYYSLGHTIDHIIENTPCDTIVVKPAVNKKNKSINRIYMATSGGVHSVLAFEIGNMLADYHNADFDIYSYKLSENKLIEKSFAKLKAAFTKKISIHNSKCHFYLKESTDVVKSILKDSDRYDIIILGASEMGIFKKRVFGDIPETIARKSKKELIMVKSNKGIKSFISRWFGT